MAEEQEKSALERLGEKLYRRGRQPEKKSHEFSEREFKVPEDWNESIVVNESPVAAPGFPGALLPSSPPETGRAGFRWRFSNIVTMKKLFILSLIFFACAALFFFFVILRGSNIVSTRNVSILVDGPSSVEAGEPLSLKIIIENGNNTALEFSDLLVEYPEGTRAAKNLEEELTRFRKSLGTIAPRETVTETADATLFGQEGEEKELAITLEYRAKGSNAIFVAERKYQVHISASPFALRASAPNEVSAKQEFEFEVALSSKASETIEDVLVFVDYPFGFVFSDSSPEPSFGNDIWSLGDIQKGGNRAIKVRGALEGQDGDEKVFRVEGGLADKNNPQKIGVVYGTALEAIRIVRPSLGISLALGGESEDEIAIPAGRSINGDILVRNNTATKITDTRVTLGFTGDILQKSSVVAQDGFYRSIDNTIAWDKNTYAALSEIAPGGNVRLFFSFAALSPLLSSVRLKNPVILLSARAEGEHVSDEGTLKDVLAQASQTAKINSDIEFAQEAMYYEGPFPNSGPLPPKADTETTYTIIWSVVNTANDVRDVVVRAVLPPYVRFTGAVSPAGETIVYDDNQRTVTWRALEIKAWKGIASLPHEAMFQVGLLPSITQVGRVPVLVESVSFSGFDSFTNAALSAQGAAVTTELATDSKFKAGEGTVTQ